ncbi:MAG TPA: SIR2 family protein [Solirubrobacter sp.]
MPTTQAAAMTNHGASREHFEKVIHYLANGELVPLLGAGVNVCDRQAAEVYEQGRNLPSGSELSELLASEYAYPADRTDRKDLIRVAQFAQAQLRHSDEEHRLRDTLHRVFRAQYGPTSVHRFLAGVPGRTSAHVLVLTTNYDDALEQAFDDAGEPYSVIFYRASRQGRCWLRHGEETEAKVIARPERYTGVSLHERSVILKVHGAVDRRERRSFNDSYVVSEDHYIDFLASTRLETLVPKGLLVPLLNSALLFLGYRLRDWNLRVILHELWNSRDFEYPAWAVHRDVDEVDAAIWRSRNVSLFDVELCAYVEELSARLGDGLYAA